MQPPLPPPFYISSSSLQNLRAAAVLERAEKRRFFCQMHIWWNVGVTNRFFLSKRLRSVGDYHLVPVLPSALAVVVFIIERFDAETVMRRQDAVIDESLGQQTTLFRWTMASMLSGRRAAR